MRKKSFMLVLFFLVSSSSLGCINVKPKLYDYAKNIYSQFGEDGIINKIFEVIGTRSKLCIEFGAHDGLSLANTAALWKDSDWKAVLIESEIKRFRELQDTIASLANVIGINAYVGTGDQSLEAILQRYNVDASDIDLLSIDIDGNDYYILEALQLKPRVIICEYNPTIPAWLDIYGPQDSDFGASVSALERVARPKGYQLVALTDTNAFFVVEDECYKLEQFETQLKAIVRNAYLINIITNYRGEYIMVGDADPQSSLLPGNTFHFGYGAVKAYQKKLFSHHVRLNFSYKLYLQGLHKSLEQCS